MKKNSYTLSFILLLNVWVVGQPLSRERDFEKLPNVHWKFRTTAPVFSSPVIRDGVVYAGGLDSTLYALDLLTGVQKWKLKTNGSIRSTVCVQDNRIFLMGGNGILTCIDKASAKPVWRVVLDPTALFLSERKYDFADYYHSSPVIDENILYVGLGNGRMNALKAENGEIIWSFKAGDMIHNSPVFFQGNVYFGCFDGNVYALDKKTGVLVWKFKSIGNQYFPTGEMQGSPAMGYGAIFIGSRDYNFYALNAQGGYANWNLKFPRGWGLSATVQDSVLYIGTSDDRIVMAVDARNGQELWRTNVKFNVFGGCAFTSGMLYVPTIWGKVFGLEKRTGQIKWEFATEGHTANKAKYYNEDDTFRRDIVSILPSAPDWIHAEYRMGGVFSTPAISGDYMVITSTEGTIYCLKRN